MLMRRRAFPIEIFREIISYVHSHVTLCTLRLVSNAFCELATPAAFRILRISMTEKGMESLYCIENSKSLSRMVRDLTLMNTDDTLANRTDHYHSLHMINHLKCLHTLRLDFSCRHLAGVTVAAILAEIWQGVRPSSLRCLVISPNISAGGWSEMGIFGANYMDGIESMVVCPASAEAPDGYLSEPLCTFWSGVLSSVFLIPARHTLSILRLHSDQYVGLIPLIEWPLLNFPHLHTLSLSRIIFSGSPDAFSNVEHFITRHSSGLQRLELLDCPMFVPLTHPGRLWSSVWTGFSESLASLVEITVRRSTNVDGKTEAYVGLEDGWGYVPEYDDIPGSQDDDAALEMLRSVVKRRASGRD